MSALISVIVPVYNAEGYLYRCLDSIRSQTYDDFEAILVNDGSADLSGKLCEDYSHKDKRFRVIHQNNKGVSIARQVGLDASVGEYVIHVDPDDWIEPTMLEELYRKISSDNADMVICDYFLNRKHNQRYIPQTIEHSDSTSVLKALLSGRIQGVCWNKLVRRELFCKYGVRFPDNMIRWEDLFVNCLLLQHDISIAYLNKAFYHYDQYTNVGSIVHHASRASVDSQIAFCDYFDDSLSDALKPYLYGCKLTTKFIAFDSKFYSLEEAKNLYPEINDRYVDEAKRRSLLPHERLFYDYLLNRPAWLMTLRYKLSMAIYNARVFLANHRR